MDPAFLFPRSDIFFFLQLVFFSQRDLFFFILSPWWYMGPCHWWRHREERRRRHLGCSPGRSRRATRLVQHAAAAGSGFLSQLAPCTWIPSGSIRYSDRTTRARKVYVTRRDAEARTGAGTRWIARGKQRMANKPTLHVWRARTWDSH
jgi:hypothetical protein